jgi:hypothetical protein
MVRLRRLNVEKGEVCGKNYDCHDHKGKDVLGRSFSSGALIRGLARENEALRTSRIPHPPLDRRFSTRGTCIYIQPFYNVHVRPKHIR